MSNKLQAVNALNDLAKAIRERQESINARLVKFNNITAELLGDASEQGRDLMLARTKLGKSLKWGDWLYAHVPNVTERQAAKYERLCREQITDPSQAVFAFLPSSEPAQNGLSKCAAPAPWEKTWGYITRLSRQEWDKWPTEQLELTKGELAGVVKALGGTVEWGSGAQDGNGGGI